MGKLNGFITSATDFAKRCRSAGLSMVGVDKKPVEYPEDRGAVALGQAMERMVETDGWKAMEEILKAWRQRAYRDLASCTPEKLQALQAEAIVVDLVLSRPIQYIEEGKAAMARLQQAQDKGE